MKFGRSALKQLIFAIALCLGLSTGPVAASEDADIEIGTRLADMLRAGRSVVSANQSLINDPNIGDKGFTGESLVRQAEEVYAS
jgi:hypothetical protein